MRLTKEKIMVDTTKDPKDARDQRRDEIEELHRRVEADQQVELEAQQARAASAVTIHAAPETDADKLARLEAENEKMRVMITGALDTRSRARDFMTIWSDPKKLPELAQEIYTSHPNIAKISKDAAPIVAQQAARLMAHIGVTYGIHPLINGMIYAWLDGGKLYVEVGYRGYQEMLHRYEHYDIDGPREMTPEEKVLHGVGPEDKGAVCFIYDWKRMERFKANDLPAPTPFYGVGIWRANNNRGKADNIAASKSNQWMAEKNAIKDVARRVLSFDIVQVAKQDIPEVGYDDEAGLWTLPVPMAEWVKNPSSAAKFKKLLEDREIDEAAFNEFIGHDWRYTTLSPDDIKAKVDEYRIANPKIVNGVFVEADQAPEPREQPALHDDPAYSAAQSRAQEIWGYTAPWLATTVQAHKNGGKNTGGLVYGHSSKYIRRLGYKNSQHVKDTLGFDSVDDWTGTLGDLLAQIVLQAPNPDGVESKAEKD
jgi:hypothetical protein